MTKKMMKMMKKKRKHGINKIQDMLSMKKHLEEMMTMKEIEIGSDEVNKM